MRAIACLAFRGCKFQSSVVFPKWKWESGGTDLLVQRHGSDHFAQRVRGSCPVQTPVAIFVRASL